MIKRTVLSTTTRRKVTTTTTLRPIIRKASKTKTMVYQRGSVKDNK